MLRPCTLPQQWPCHLLPSSALSPLEFCKWQHQDWPSSTVSMPCALQFECLTETLCSNILSISRSQSELYREGLHIVKVHSKQDNVCLFYFSIKVRGGTLTSYRFLFDHSQGVLREYGLFWWRTLKQCINKIQNISKMLCW